MKAWFGSRYPLQSPDISSTEIAVRGRAKIPRNCFAFAACPPKARGTITVMDMAGRFLPAAILPSLTPTAGRVPSKARPHFFQGRRAQTTITGTITVSAKSRNT